MWFWREHNITFSVLALCWNSFRYIWFWFKLKKLTRRNVPARSNTLVFTFMFWETKGRTESVSHICQKPINPNCLWFFLKISGSQNQYIHQKPNNSNFINFVIYNTLNKLDILILTVQPKMFMVHVAAFIVAWPLFPYCSNMLTDHGDNLRFPWKVRSKIFSLRALVVFYQARTMVHKGYLRQAI